jgi:hypothetical protein
MLMPIVGVSVTAGAWLVGYDQPEGWGQPIAPFWMAAGLAAAILGIVAKEPGRRGVLVVPFMIGALVLTFWLGEILVPHLATGIGGARILVRRLLPGRVFKNVP